MPGWKYDEPSSLPRKNPILVLSQPPTIPPLSIKRLWRSASRSTAATVASTSRLSYLAWAVAWFSSIAATLALSSLSCSISSCCVGSAALAAPAPMTPTPSPKASSAAVHFRDLFVMRDLLPDELGKRVADAHLTQRPVGQ